MTESEFDAAWDSFAANWSRPWKGTVKAAFWRKHRKTLALVPIATFAAALDEIALTKDRRPEPDCVMLELRRSWRPPQTHSGTTEEVSTFWDYISADMRAIEEPRLKRCGPHFFVLRDPRNDYGPRFRYLGTYVTDTHRPYGAAYGYVMLDLHDGKRHYMRPEDAGQYAYDKRGAMGHERCIGENDLRAWQAKRGEGPRGYAESTVIGDVMPPVRAAGEIVDDFPI